MGGFGKSEGSKGNAYVTGLDLDTGVRIGARWGNSTANTK
jgi:hypothetical protein